MFVRKKTVMFSLYKIKWRVYIEETECVYCAILTEKLNITDFNINHLKG